MSRAGAKAQKEKRAHERRLRLAEEEFERLERDLAADVTLVACAACGLEQVNNSSRVIGLVPPWHGGGFAGQEAGLKCVLCGCETATHADTFS